MKPGLVGLIIFAVFVAVSVVGVGGYLVFQAVSKPGDHILIAVFQDPGNSASTSEEIVRSLVSMQQIDVVYEASPEELPKWFPGERPWGDTQVGTFLVKLKTGADREAVQANLRNLPGVDMVVDVPDTGRSIGASGVM